MFQRSIFLCLAFFFLFQTSCISQAEFSRNRGDGEKSFFDFDVKDFKKPMALPEGATVLKDLPFGKEKQQKLDIYLPNKEILQKNAPIIIMVHGGAWMMGNKSNAAVVNNKVDRWLKKGILFVSTNYRISRKPNPLDQVDDIEMAFQYMVNNATKYGGDPTKIVLMGHSAGAHLVSLFSTSGDYAKNKWLGTIALDSAAFDLIEIMDRKHYRFYDRVFGSDRDFWKKTSPIHQLSGKINPMLLVCSSKRFDSCPQAEIFTEKAKGLGAEVSVLPVDLNHGQVNVNLGLDGKYTEDVEIFMKKIGVTGL